VSVSICHGNDNKGLQFTGTYSSPNIITVLRNSYITASNHLLGGTEMVILDWPKLAQDHHIGNMSRRKLTAPDHEAVYLILHIHHSRYCSTSQATTAPKD